ncbi:MAG: hypothetical protein SOT17_03380 [Lactobacillus johnsonii]|nr:hypothetical protein [Lactobacillus johnsonii]MDY2874296.1 hypothetical protein [Lactobacillus johnsonii]
MKVIDERIGKDSIDDLKPGDVVEYWNNDNKKSHGIVILFEDEGKLKYLNLRNAVTGSFGSMGNFETLIEYTFDHRACFQKVNAKLVLED